MTADREHVLFEELAAGHALGALEPEDEQSFLSHLPGCAACARDLAQHLETAASLAVAAPSVDLPDGLGSRLRAAVEAESPEAFTVLPAAAAQASDSGAPAQLDAARERRAARQGRSRGLVAAAAAVVVLVAGLSGATLVLQQEARTQTARGEQLAVAVQALAEEGGVSVPLRDPEQRVSAVALMHDGLVSLVVDGLEPNEAGSSYVLWALSRYGGKLPVGVFDVRGEGVEVLRDLPLAGASDVEGFAVTAEQGDTAPASPGGVPLVVGTLEA